MTHDALYIAARAPRPGLGWGGWSHAAREAAGRPVQETASYDDRVAWLYALCREHLFRDDTAQIVDALWDGRQPASGSLLFELGCGPGYYARRLAERYRQLRVVGIDISERQVGWARARASRGRLENCQFERGDVRALDQAPDVADAVVAARILMAIPERERVVDEIHRLLQPGGRCFIAEPRSTWRAYWTRLAHWLYALPGGVDDLRSLQVMTDEQFHAVVESQPWQRIAIWRDADYQYAVCEKRLPGERAAPLERRGGIRRP